ncbi:efflux RND transporter periplasmic adaptor subunit [Micromonospora sp. WMMD1128]|uniref:efflux RND transporter periplasmic adaptor subunit n=1 Tax=Micromonospora sp. WMMD1128 TaxID=3015150 RepID=UPI00248C428C|nr:efflux RND transporter periplasmic adaptor subunit [Micromonospora sp. WMMD1128]WBB73968.1 efflux RND transporter periplasmic adaptor subunit [Micromonospora sp. WMMD1128]
MPLTRTVPQSDTETQVIPRVEAPPAPRRRYLRVMIPAVVLAAVTTAAVVAWSGRNAGPAPTADEPTGVRSVAVVKQDISTSQSLPGTLGFGAARLLKGSGSGTVTWLPAQGASVRRGQQLYRVDDRPVPLFYGGMPLFRPLHDLDTVGRDVRIVVDNLRALGYDVGDQPKPGTRLTRTPSTPTPARTVARGDGVLTTALRDAVKRWQNDLGVPATGAIEPGDVVVLVGAVRVDSVAAQPGDGADATLMSVTQTSKVVTVQAGISDAGSIEQGDAVTVHLPDESTINGRVTAVGQAVQAAEGEAGAGGAPPTVTVTIAVKNSAATARISLADVRVDFAAETHKDVLVVPVGALLALSEGGYGVQISGGGLVAVETGLFAQGLVEVEGDGLDAGTMVVTTS